MDALVETVTSKTEEDNEDYYTVVTRSRAHDSFHYRMTNAEHLTLRDLLHDCACECYHSASDDRRFGSSSTLKLELKKNDGCVNDVSDDDMIKSVDTFDCCVCSQIHHQHRHFMLDIKKQ